VKFFYFAANICEVSTSSRAACFRFFVLKERIRCHPLSPQEWFPRSHEDIFLRFFQGDAPRPPRAGLRQEWWLHHSNWVYPCDLKGLKLLRRLHHRARSSTRLARGTSRRSPCRSGLRGRCRFPLGEAFHRKWERSHFGNICVSEARIHFHRISIAPALIPCIPKMKRSSVRQCRSPREAGGDTPRR
jgi:hypothetical protein